MSAQISAGSITIEFAATSALQLPPKLGVWFSLDIGYTLQLVVASRALLLGETLRGCNGLGQNEIDSTESHIQKLEG